MFRNNSETRAEAMIASDSFLHPITKSLQVSSARLCPKTSAVGEKPAHLLASLIPLPQRKGTPEDGSSWPALPFYGKATQNSMFT